MTDDEDFVPPPSESALRRWGRRFRKFALWTLAVFGVIALTAYAGRWQVGRMGERRLRAEVGRLDAEDPNWKADAVFEERQKGLPADDRNSAPAVLNVAEQIPADWLKWRNSEDAGRWWTRYATNRLPPIEVTAEARKFAADTHLARTEAIRLRDRRAGGFAINLRTDPLATTLPHLDKCRQVVSFLQYDAYLAAIDKNPNRAVSAVRAMLAVSRAIGDEPFLVSQLVRIACCVIAAQTTAQVLAWGEPTDGLEELQAELLAEAEVPFFRVGLRGERAMLDTLFRGLADGTVPPETWFAYVGTQAKAPQYVAFRAYKPLIPGDHAKALELMSQYVEASKLPHHEQLAAIKQVPIPPGPPDDIRYITTRAAVPACQQIAEAGLRARAELLAAATGVAVERYRRKNGRWPRNLDELLPTFLPKRQINPFNDMPTAYRVLDDRVAVYFYWAGSARKAEEIPADFHVSDPRGAVFGLRLWNPDRRGLPPEEKPPEEKKDP